MITVPDPLSAALMIMSVRRRSCLRASRSGVVRLLRTGLGVRLRMSRSTAQMKASKGMSMLRRCPGAFDVERIMVGLSREIVEILQ